MSHFWQQHDCNAASRQQRCCHKERGPKQPLHQSTCRMDAVAAGAQQELLSAAGAQSFQ
jgi:hypothetical protein